MIRVKSRQRDVKFLWCGSPITIDKRNEWGTSGDNVQIALNGAFLKLKSDTEISHLVQPNEDKTAPVGWVRGSSDGLFDKQPIYVYAMLIQPGETVRIETLDGPISYTATEPSVLCANELDGKPNQKDQWVQTLLNLKKNYEVG